MYSVVIPVYNRPDEVDELLSSLTRQTHTDFEVLVVEDGSSVPCGTICSGYSDRLDIHYLTKEENSGPGASRNYGVAQAKGEFILIFDSDITLPENYFDVVAQERQRHPCDAFGGPDRAHPSFSTTQKAISYAMTAFLTTGGIRGRKAHMDKFYPRSYNMGISKTAFTAVGGFADMRYGEDIDLSLRLIEAGFSCRLFPDAWVWHKRRTTLKQFFHQVFHSGEARIALHQRHPKSLKLVHLLPSAFTVAVPLLVLAAIITAFFTSFWWVCISPIILYCLLILADAGLQNRSLTVALVSIPAAFVQLFGYGTGLIAAATQRT